MTDVIWNPNFNYNLFSASRCLKDGWTMQGSSEGIIMTSPDERHQIVFDQKIKTKQGMVYAEILRETWKSQVRKLIS